ncbi:hypothetical protein TNCV_2427451 [Trichonephila clavipes]|nr:hypothetical protein TNCV_2427451 [Trichonephila clavipes]
MDFSSIEGNGFHNLKPWSSESVFTIKITKRYSEVLSTSLLPSTVKSSLTTRGVARYPKALVEKRKAKLQNNVVGESLVIYLEGSNSHTTEGLRLQNGPPRLTGVRSQRAFLSPIRCPVLAIQKATGVMRLSMQVETGGESIPLHSVTRLKYGSVADLINSWSCFVHDSEE